tara:strand:- start:3082 stop:3456 length:375 start_codon:yes stop_codon:yes gene_type:complete
MLCLKCQIWKLFENKCPKVFLYQIKGLYLHITNRRYNMSEEFDDFYLDDEDGSMPTENENDYLESIKDRLARANYEAIIKHGIDADQTRNPEVIRRIIEETIFYFQDLEEYEKCADLKYELEKL